MARNNDAVRLQKVYTRISLCVSVSVFFIGSKESCLLCGYTGTVFFTAVRLPLPSILINCEHATKTLYRLELPTRIHVYTNISYVGMIHVTHADMCETKGS